MSRPVWGRPVALLLAALGLLCWVEGARRAVALTGAPLLVEMYWDGTEILGDGQRAALEEERTSFALVREHRELEVTATLLGRKQTLTALEVLGDASLLVDAAALREGAMPHSGLLQCAVDQETAHALWGYGEAVGQVLVIGHTPYTVSGVFASSQPLLIRSGGGAGFAPSYGVVSPGPESLFPLQEAGALIDRTGLPQPTRISDTAFATALLRQLAFLPMWIPCLVGAYLCLHALLPGVGELHTWGRRLGWLLSLWGTGKVLGFSVAFLSDYLPTRWSDFSFWREMLERMRRDLALSLSGGTSLPSLLRWEGQHLPILLFSGGALGCFLLALLAFRPAPLAFSAAPPPREVPEA